MKAVILIVASIVGVYFVLRSSRKYYLEVKAKPKTERTSTDLFLNYPLQIIWNLYLVVFFVGLIVNNLIFK